MPCKAVKPGQTLANSADDPDQTPQNPAYDQGPNCLLKLQKVKGKPHVQDHFPSLYSEMIEPPVLSVL